jgi:ribosomal protein L24
MLVDFDVKLLHDDDRVEILAGDHKGKLGRAVIGDSTTEIIVVLDDSQQVVVAAAAVRIVETAPQILVQ